MRLSSRIASVKPRKSRIGEKKDYGRGARTTAWRKIKKIMTDAGIDNEAHAVPKGLRHGVGVAAVQAGIPLNLVQKWLGHAQLTTTAIYANAVGAEEQNIASKMW
jgi:integrase/recombinase XerD